MEKTAPVRKDSGATCAKIVTYLIYSRPAIKTLSWGYMIGPYPKPCGTIPLWSRYLCSCGNSATANTGAFQKVLAISTSFPFCIEVITYVLFENFAHTYAFCYYFSPQQQYLLWKTKIILTTILFYPKTFQAKTFAKHFLTFVRN